MIARFPFLTEAASTSFLIPVRSEAARLIAIPVTVDGTEDKQIPLGGINITNVGGLDPDASWELFLEIATSSYPEGTHFFSGGVPVGTENTGGHIWIPKSAHSSLEIDPPPNFSGPIELLVRGHYRYDGPHS